MKKEPFPPLPASFLSLSQQQGGFSLKYQHTKRREAANVSLAIISSSLHVVIRSAFYFDSTINLSEEHHRRSVQHWDGRSREGSLGAYGQPAQLLQTKQHGAAPFYILLVAKYDKSCSVAFT